MFTMDEVVTEMVSVIKIEDGEQLLTEAESFEQGFIKVENAEELADLVPVDVNEVSQIQIKEEPGSPVLDTAYHLEHPLENEDLLSHENEYPVVAIKQEPPETSSEADAELCGDVAEKIRSRFLKILEKQSTVKLLLSDATRGTRIQNANCPSTNEPEYILPQSSCTDEKRRDGTLSIRGGATSSLPTAGLHGCRACPAAFPSVEELMKHEEIHGHRYYRCEFCNAAFEKLVEARFHRLIHAPGRLLKYRKEHRCDTCGRTFSLLGRLQRHKHKHTHTRKPYVCPDCGRVLKFPSLLKIHQKMHKKQKKKAERLEKLRAKRVQE